MLPRTLHNFNVFTDGNSWAGVATEVTLPTLTKKTEDYRGAGMIGDVALTLGYEKLECEITYGGFDTLHFTQLKHACASSLPIRFVGVYKRQDTCANMLVEIYMRGSMSELDLGTAKLGEQTEHKTKMNISYFRLNVDGQEICELDLINGIEKFGDTDLVQQLKQLLGL